MARNSEVQLVCIHGISTDRGVGWSLPWMHNLSPVILHYFRVIKTSEFTWEPPEKKSPGIFRDLFSDIWSIANPNLDDRLREIIIDGTKGGQRPVLVLAHSWGSVLAYRTLLYMAERHKRCVGLVTFGSPLAAAFRSPLHVIAPDILPLNCRWWSNVWGRLDLVCTNFFWTGRIPVADENIMAWSWHDSRRYVRSRGMKKAVKHTCEKLSSH